MCCIIGIFKCNFICTSDEFISIFIYLPHSLYEFVHTHVHTHIYVYIYLFVFVYYVVMYVMTF